MKTLRYECWTCLRSLWDKNSINGRIFFPSTGFRSRGIWRLFKPSILKLKRCFNKPYSFGIEIILSFLEISNIISSSSLEEFSTSDWTVERRIRNRYSVWKLGLRYFIGQFFKLIVSEIQTSELMPSFNFTFMVEWNLLYLVFAKNKLLYQLFELNCWQLPVISCKLPVTVQPYLKSSSVNFANWKAIFGISVRWLSDKCSWVILTDVLFN